MKHNLIQPMLSLIFSEVRLIKIAWLDQLENRTPLDTKVEDSILTPYKKAGGSLETALLPLGRSKVVYISLLPNLV